MCLKRYRLFTNTELQNIRSQFSETKKEFVTKWWLLVKLLKEAFRTYIARTYIKLCLFSMRHSHVKYVPNSETVCIDSLVQSHTV